MKHVIKHEIKKRSIRSTLSCKKLRVRIITSTSFFRAPAPGVVREMIAVHIAELYADFNLQKQKEAPAE